MKMPLKPPTIEDIYDRLPEDRFRLILEGRPLVEGKYLHWDNIRHRHPPDGLSHEEWWSGIKFARHSASESMPLLDKEGQAFRLVYVAPIRRGLHEIDQRFGMTGPSSEVKDMVDAHSRMYFLSNSLMEEAIRSSQLEGASTTRARAKDMIRGRRMPRDKSERMILNNFHAMERIEELASMDLTADRVFELHSILVDGTLDDPSRAGVFREAEDNIVVELLHTVQTAHVPPSAHELPERMGRILDFANATIPEEWLHPVLRAVILHFMIGYDHPFVDGNGRVARALFYWAMARYGYPYTKFLSISRVLRESPTRYARAYLHTETDDGDLTYFIDHQLQVILQSFDALANHVEQKMSATRKLEEELRASSNLNHRQLRLLGHALRHPGFEYTVQSHQDSHRVVNNTARTDLLDLVAKGLLVKAVRGRKHVFISPRDLEGRLKTLEGS